MKRLWCAVVVLFAFVLVSFMSYIPAGFAESLRVAPLNPDFEEFAAAFSPGSREANATSGFHFGYMPPPVSLKALNPVPSLTVLRATANDLPAKWDWREQNGVTPVKNQGSCGSCWAFGSIGALESRHKIRAYGHPNMNWSEENMNSCHTPWLWDRCEGGNTFVSIAYLTGLVKKSDTQQFQKGVLNEGQDAYKGSNSHDSALCDDSTRPFPKYRITGARWVSGDTDEMKAAVYNKGPIITAFYVESLYGSHWYSDHTIYHYPGFYGYSNHEVVIVGWDDSISWPTGNGQGAWIVKNSWGNFNSMGGYFYMTYNSANVGDDAMYYTGTRKAAANENLYMEDLPGWLFNIGCGSSVAYGATVFAPLNENEKLTHVDFFNPFNDMPYTIKVWGTVASSGSGVSFSNVKATKRGRCQETGYYAIELTTPVTLTKGKNYGVTITFKDPSGGGYPIPTAAVYPGLVGAFAGKGNATGYYRCAATGAFDRAVIDGDTHVPCVRARTVY